MVEAALFRRRSTDSCGKSFGACGVSEVAIVRGVKFLAEPLGTRDGEDDDVEKDAAHENALEWALGEGRKRFGVVDSR